MNDEKLKNKVRQDAANVKNDISSMVQDSATLLNRFEDNVSKSTEKAKDDLTSWVKEEAVQLKTGLEKVASDASKTVNDSAAVIKKDVGRGLRQYNTRAQKYADKVPGNLGKQAASYPWVAMSIVLVLGLLIGSLLKPARQPLG
jgi:ElaB/YqjD/DUF883 family membrane-anchored ribosome-binding protein